MGYLNLVGVGDSLEYLKRVPDNSIDSVVVDPPYGLGKPPPPLEVLRAWMNGDDYQAKGSGFLGNTWDAFVPGPPIWRECLRVLKPGGYLTAFFGTRTYDWGTLAIRIAGFDVTDCLMWVYGSGFPKGQDIGKQIDKHLGVFDQREIVGSKNAGLDKGSNGQAKLMTKVGRNDEGLIDITVAASPEAQAWEGWNSALKPAHEPICLARKPMIGKFAENVLDYGTGGLNIEGSRVAGRYPNNVILGHLAGCVEDTCKEGCAVRTLGKQSGHSVSRPMKGDAETLDQIGNTSFGTMKRVGTQLNDSGTAARFFYTAKAASKNRWAYCKKCKVVINHTAKEEFNKHLEDHEDEILSHPTQKPIKLMEYLVNLVTQKGGVVLDPFCGCYDSQTEVLTGRGFVPWPEATEEDLYATRASDGQIRFVSPSGLIRKQHVGVMHHYRGRSVDLLVTPNHNMLFREHHAEEAALIPSEDAVASVYHIPNQAMWLAPNVDTLRVGEIELRADAWLRFFGLYLAEGHVNRERGYGVLVKQSKSPEGVNAVRRVFHALESVSRQREHTYGDLTLFVLQERNMHAACAAVGYQHERRIPRSYMKLGPRNLTALYEGLMLGDGCETMGGRECYFTCSPGLADDVAELMIRLGRAATISARRKKQPRIGDRLIVNHRVQYTVRARYAKELKVTTKKMRTEVPFNGVVHCVVVPPHHTLLVKRNGKIAWCGNTGTTAVAAKRTGRSFVTCELDPNYAKIARARVGTVGVHALEQLQQGSYFCPGCRAKGEIKLIAKKAVDRMKESGKKTTCVKCMKRYAYEELV